jgi:hypothetical protein
VVHGQKRQKYAALPIQIAVLVSIALQSSFIQLTKMPSSQFQFLLRIVAQLKEDGRSIKWEKINLPGRTTKSLQNMWTKINKQIADFEAQENSGEATPAKTPRKRGPRK